MKKKLSILGWSDNTINKSSKKIKILLQKIIYLKFDILIDGDKLTKNNNLTEYLLDNINPVINKLDNNNTIFKKNIINSISNNDKKRILFNVDYIIILDDGSFSLNLFSELLNDNKNIPIYLFGNKCWNSLKGWFEFNSINWDYKNIKIITEDINDIIKDIKYQEEVCKKSNKSLPLLYHSNLLNKKYKPLKPIRYPPKPPSFLLKDFNYISSKKNPLYENNLFKKDDIDQSKNDLSNPFKNDLFKKDDINQSKNDFLNPFNNDE